MGGILNSDGTQSFVHSHNDGTGSVTFEERQDAEPILKQAIALHNDGHHGTKEWKHAAKLPRVLVDKYCLDHGISFHEFLRDKVHLRRMLMDRDNRMFRIWPGRV